jgi:hypothetical protein
MERFQSIGQLLVALSVSLIIFPFISLPAIESIVSRTRELGIAVNPELVGDYASGCFIVLLLSLLETMVVILYSLIPIQELLLIIFSLLCSQMVVVLILVLFLWRATALLYYIARKK